MCERREGGNVVSVVYVRSATCWTSLGIDRKEEAGENGSSPAWSMPDTRKNRVPASLVWVQDTKEGGA